MDNDIYQNERAMAILKNAEAELIAIGCHCRVSPMSLPQGLIVSLHIAETESAMIAANVATVRGGMEAHATETAEDFSTEVASIITDRAIFNARKQK